MGERTLTADEIEEQNKKKYTHTITQSDILMLIDSLSFCSATLQGINGVIQNGDIDMDMELLRRLLNSCEVRTTGAIRDVLIKFLDSEREVNS